MRNYIIGSVVLASALLVGCGSDGGHCCGGDSALALDQFGNQILPIVRNNPVAVIDINDTFEYSIEQSGGENSVQGGTYSSSAPTVSGNITYIIGCKNSYDQDDNNSIIINDTIIRCDWNITTASDRCGELNATTGTEIKIVCLDDSDNIDTMILKLTVTDDENQTDENSTTIQF